MKTPLKDTCVLHVATFLKKAACCCTLTLGVEKKLSVALRPGTSTKCEERSPAKTQHFPQHVQAFQPASTEVA